LTASFRVPSSDVTAGDKLPIRMLHDRVLVSTDAEAGERRSGGGIVIPATAKMGRRLVWGRVVALGGNVRVVELGDLHAVAAGRLDDGATGLYL
jgi:chaperonin GroES